jgi:hypothetical protein
MLLLRLLKPEFVFEPQADTLYLGFNVERDVPMIVFMFFEEQAEGLFSTELSDASEVLDPEAIQNLGSLQLAFTRTKRALDFLVH